MTRVLGAVLAGGLSSRFGSDKALAQWEGRSLIDHALATLDRCCDDVIICGRHTVSRKSVADRPRAGLGPLGGLNAALHFALREGFVRVITIGCDTPLLPPALIDLLTTGEGPCVLYEQPIIGGWPASLASQLDDFIAWHPTRSMRAWAEASGADRINFDGIPNVNFSEDLASLNQPDEDR